MHERESARRTQRALVLSSFVLVCFALHTAADHALKGTWVRYRSNFHDFSLGFNKESSSALRGAPAAIFFPAGGEDIQWFSSSFGDKFTFSVRSGGHSYEGLSTSPCSLTIDTANLSDYAVIGPIDYDRRIANVKVGAGVRHGALYSQLAKSELGLPGANCLDVGVTGCAVGGCHGYLSGAFGLTSDCVRSFEIILANATLLTVSRAQHPDLFWALRGGGGGDFGVVTSLELEAKLVRGVVTYEIAFDFRGEEAAMVVDLLMTWQQWALDDLPNATSAYLSCSSSFDCVARGVLPGRDDTDVQRAVNRLVSKFEVEPVAAVSVMEHLDMQQRFNGCKVNEAAGHKVKSLYFGEAVPFKVVEGGVSVLAKAEGLPSAVWSGVEVQRVGHAPRGSAPVGSAADMYHRSKFLWQLSTSWTAAGGADGRNQHHVWVRQLHSALAPTTTGAYRNFEDLDMGATYYTHGTWASHPASFYYPDAGVLALEQTKMAYDPRGVFQHALSASFAASEKEALDAACESARWAEAPEEAVGELPASWVLLGEYVAAEDGQLQEGQLAGVAARITHAVFSGVQPLWGGWVNVSAGETTGQELQRFVQTSRQANPRAKLLVSVGGAGAISAAEEWTEAVGAAWARHHFGLSVRAVLDAYELDGVAIDWQPTAEHRTNFTLLLRAVREKLRPQHLLTVHADVSREALLGPYDARSICNVSDFVVLRTVDLEPLLPDSQLQRLTHFGANLFSVNPTLASGAGGVATWLAAGAPRSKLVLRVATYGDGYDVDGEPPATAGRLDWNVRGKTAALTELSHTPGQASWAELHDRLEKDWSTWTSEEVPELGAAAAWSEDLRVWVGYDSPGTAKQKAEWVKSMGLAGVMLGPLHMDAFGTGKRSLVEALREGLSIELVEDDAGEEVDVLVVTLACVIPAIFLGCCVDAQLRRWGDIRRIHDSLMQVSNTTDSWNEHVRSSPIRAGPRGDQHTSVAGVGGELRGPAEGSRTPPQERPRRWSAQGWVPAVVERRDRRKSLTFFAKRFSTASSAQPKPHGHLPHPARSNGSNLPDAPVLTPLARAGGPMASTMQSSTSSMVAVQSAFDGAMQKGVSHGFDEELSWTYAGVGAMDSAALRQLSDGELSRKLALLHKAKHDAGSLAPPKHAGSGHADGYDLQRGVVRYSRLLVRDAAEWLENPDCDYMNFYNTKRRGVIKLTIVITMYAETPDLLERSLRGIAHGIHQLATETAFLRSWDEACVVIVSDGLAKLNPETAKWLEQMGVYSRALIDDAAKLDEALEGEKPEVALHCFEGLMQFEDWSPTQTMLLVKQTNAGKLDSQRWAFIGMAERLMPVMPVGIRTAAHGDSENLDLDGLTFNDLRALDRYLVTVDAGTQPMPNSLRELLIPMRYDPTIAGTCGHMIPDKTVSNFLVMSQVFEYEHGHIVDKSMESMFGFITVLPGAYSAFRYDAIRQDQWVDGRYRRVGPLVDYFKPLVESVDSPALLNMGLAEDRFLCFSLMVTKRRDYSLWYCRRAMAVTDVPDSLQAFLQQRRRWNNGAFFTRLFTIWHYFEMFDGTGHGPVKRLGFVLQLLTMLVDSVFVWFAAALFYLWIAYNVERLGEGAAQAMGPCFLIMYLLAVVAHYDRRVAEIKWVHRLIALALALEIFFCLAVFVYDQAREPDLWLIALVFGSFGCMFLCALAQGKFLKLLGMLGAYLLMYPTYAILAQLYGFCHVHDVSWGTKGIETVHSDGGQSKAEQVRTALSSFRFRILVAFILSNFTFGYVVEYYNRQYNILLILLLIIVSVNGVRYVGSLAFTVVCWLDDALQLTALHGGIGREFGGAYQAMREQVRRINRGDIRTAHGVFSAFRRRTTEQQQRRREEQLRQAEASARPVQLQGDYFDSDDADEDSSEDGQPRRVDPPADPAQPQPSHRPRRPPNLRIDHARPVAGASAVPHSAGPVLQGARSSSPPVPRPGSAQSAEPRTHGRAAMHISDTPFPSPSEEPAPSLTEVEEEDSPLSRAPVPAPALSPPPSSFVISDPPQPALSGPAAWQFEGPGDGFRIEGLPPPPVDAHGASLPLLPAARELSSSADIEAGAAGPRQHWVMADVGYAQDTMPETQNPSR